MGAVISYTIISESQAQSEHEALSMSKKIGYEHKAKSWKDCSGCKRRFKTLKVKVIKP